MNPQNPNIENECPRAGLAAYIDGELSPREELDLETHLAECEICAFELNEQKRLLFALDFALEGEREFKLPENFTKVVVANAESEVSGLRCPKERFRAVFVITALFLLFILGLGGETRTVLDVFLKFGEQIFAVGNFALHLIYDVAIAASIILRSLCSQFMYNSVFSIIFFTAFFFVSLFVLSRLVIRNNQA
ncbi:MAG TPA: zf-HC2 domain-containing protein [Pyrinomonadaceae bacterium]|nr:zf-HC2 domain-containing protein [Pyrinomonadaceae bacterium]